VEKVMEILGECPLFIVDIRKTVTTIEVEICMQNWRLSFAGCNIMFLSVPTLPRVGTAFCST
jgi:hypothetical protein